MVKVGFSNLPNMEFLKHPGFGSNDFLFEEAMIIDINMVKVHLTWNLN